MLIFANLKNSRIGRAWMAIREDEDAARANGIKTGRPRSSRSWSVPRWAAGRAVFAHKTQHGRLRQFPVPRVGDLAAAVVLAHGHDPRRGAGCVVAVRVAEKLREFNDYRLLMFGLALVLIMRFRPQGLVPDRVRGRVRREHLRGCPLRKSPKRRFSSRKWPRPGPLRPGPSSSEGRS